MPHPLNIPVRAWKYWSEFSRLGKEAKERHGVSKWRMMREHWALRKLNGLRWTEYFGFRLFDPGMTWEEKAEFIGMARLRPLWSALNPIEYRYLFKNKLVFNWMCVARGVPVPRLLGVFDPDWGHTSDGKPLKTASDIEAFIRSLDDGQIVAKPVAGAEGRMVLAFEGMTSDEPPALVASNGTEYSAQSLHEFMTDESAVNLACSGTPDIAPTFLLEERVAMHSDLAALSPHTLSTFRVVTIRDRGVPAEIAACTYKLEGDEDGKDNYWGVGVAVDMDKGLLGDGWDTPFDLFHGDLGSLPTLERLAADPRTGLRFKGMPIPFWEEIKECALRAAEAFPMVRSIGWDIAVAPDGPKVIEGNWGWGFISSQAPPGRGIYRGQFKAVCERLRREGKADRALV